MLPQITDIVSSHEHLPDALTGLSETLAPNGGHSLLYGFYVHVHSASRNDFVMAHSHCDSLFAEADPETVFRASGGAATDIVAPNLPQITAPFPVDVRDVAEHLRAQNDTRLAWTLYYLDRGFQTVWIAPINAPWAGGYGALNHGLQARYAPPPLAEDGLIPLVHAFHDAVRKTGRLARHIGLTELELDTLQKFAQGRTTEEIAGLQKVSRQAVDQRMLRARKKLRARNTIEAMYKAMVYGALPWRPG
ncbi:MAG: helix-turn-helix transcriptional regulator [Paracoccaceae bacterium]